jgi:hypothetical protein
MNSLITNNFIIFLQNIFVTWILYLLQIPSVYTEKITVGKKI